MAPDLQTRLLRVLSDGQFYRVGGHQPLKANVRVIAATHQELEARVREGTFREDLYHRLNVIRLRLPSLRDRREDIPLLVRHFLAKSARDLGVEPKRMSEPAMNYLVAQDWPGNVRQLENVCHWLTVMAPAQAVDVGDLPPELRAGAAAGAEADWTVALRNQVEKALMRGDSAIMDALTRDFEKTLIAKALQHTGGRRIEAANLLGIGRNTITRKIAELGIEGKGEPPGEAAA
jgi:two-component system nitrogen regulation response regulator GlnG